MAEVNDRTLNAAFYNNPILYNNGAKITDTLSVPGRNGYTYTNNQISATYTEENKVTYQGSSTYTIMTRRIDLSPILERYLNHFSKAKRIRVTFKTQMSARGWYWNTSANPDDATWRDTRDYQTELRDGGGASIDIFVDNIVSKQRFKRYTVDIYDSTILQYKAKLWVSGNLDNQQLRAAGGMTVYDITIDEVEYEQDYIPMQITLTANKHSFRFNRDQSQVEFTYAITDAEDNRVVSWILYAATDPQTALYQGSSTAGTITIPFDSLYGKSPSQSYYIVAQGQRQSNAKSNIEVISFDAGDATIGISAIPSYIRYQDYDQEIKVNYRVDNLGGMSRQWGLNKTVNNNNEVLDLGFISSGKINKNYIDKMNPYNTIAPLYAGDIIDYSLLITNTSPIQRVSAKVGVYEYDINPLKINDFIWRDIEKKIITIPPYTKRKMKDKGSLLNIFRISDQDVNPASKVQEYRFRDWGGRDVSLAKTYMDGIMGTESPKQLFIEDNTPDTAKTAKRTVQYHFYVTREDKNWHLSFNDKKINKQDKLFTVNNISYANNLLTVVYRIDKLRNPQNVTVKHIAKIINETTGEIETEKADNTKAFFCGQNVLVSWSQQVGRFNDLGGFTFELYDGRGKRVYSKYIDWTQGTLSYTAGRGYDYIFKLPDDLSSGTCYLNIVAINEYNNSIKDKKEDGFTWADSESGAERLLSQLVRMDIYEKREKTEIVAPHVDSTLDGLYTFKYTRSPFLVFDAQSYMLDQMGDVIAVPVYNPEGDIEDIIQKETDRVWFEIAFGYPEQNIFNYWHPYKDLTWDEAKDRIIEILKANIARQGWTDEDIKTLGTVSATEKTLESVIPKRDENGDLEWDFLIHGCTVFWEIIKKDNINTVLKFLGIYRDLYDTFSATDWEGYADFNWEQLADLFGSWQNIGGMTALLEWMNIKDFYEKDGSVRNALWEDFAKRTWKSLNEQIYINNLEKTFKIEFCIYDNDDNWISEFYGHNDGEKDDSHSILGKGIDFKTDSFGEGFLFYDEIHDNVGFQFLKLFEAYGEFIKGTNPGSILAHLLSPEKGRYPGERFNIQIRSAYGNGDGPFETTYSEPKTITMISTELHPYSKKMENRPEDEPVIYGNHYVPENSTEETYRVDFGGQTSYMIDLMDDIVRYYKGTSGNFGDIVNTGYTYNQLAATVAKAIQFKYNPYPVDVFFDPAVPHFVGEDRPNILNGMQLDLLLQEDPIEKKDYRIDEANRSIYNNNNFLKASILTSINQLLEDQ